MFVCQLHALDTTYRKRFQLLDIILQATVGMCVLLIMISCDRQTAYSRNGLTCRATFLNTFTTGDFKFINGEYFVPPHCYKQVRPPT